MLMTDVLDVAAISMLQEVTENDERNDFIQLNQFKVETTKSIMCFKGLLEG